MSTYISERINNQGMRETEAGSVDDAIQKLQEMGDVVSVKNLQAMSAMGFKGYTCDAVFNDGSTKMLYLYEKKGRR